MGSRHKKQLFSHVSTQGKCLSAHSPLSKINSSPTMIYTHSSLHITAFVSE